MTWQVRCHHCSHWIGEAVEPLEFVAIFQSPSDRSLVSPPRMAWLCKSCGWLSVFRRRGRASWREIRVKQELTAGAAGG